MTLGERKLRVLAAVVEAYIRTGEPVGSKVLAEMLDGLREPVESAEIRFHMFLFIFFSPLYLYCNTQPSRFTSLFSKLSCLETHFQTHTALFIDLGLQVIARFHFVNRLTV